MPHESALYKSIIDIDIDIWLPVIIMSNVFTCPLTAMNESI